MFKSSRKTQLLSVIFGLFSQTCFAGYITTDAKIISISNTISNYDSFSIITSEGSGPCNGAIITFPATAASDYKDGHSSIHNRAYSAALTAFVTNTKVSVFNYQDDTCNFATYIYLRK